LQFAKANAQTKNCKRAFTFATNEKLFFKISPSKIFKASNAQATQTDQNTTRQ
jgi:hypothetical protein